MMTELEKLDQALTDADGRKWRYKAQQAEAALKRALGEAQYWESRCRREADDALALDTECDTLRLALAESKTPCVWRVEAPAHFVGHLDDKPLEMMLMATSCGKKLGMDRLPPYCAYCGHPIEVQP